MEGMVTLDLSEEKRRRRRAGIPGATDGDRDIVHRITAGDLADEFQAALDGDLVSDPELGGFDSGD